MECRHDDYSREARGRQDTEELTPGDVLKRMAITLGSVIAVLTAPVWVPLAIVTFLAVIAVLQALGLVALIVCYIIGALGALMSYATRGQYGNATMVWGLNRGTEVFEALKEGTR